MTASRTGRLGPVKALLARGADVNAREHKGQTALMWAAADGHVEVVDALLEAGADFRTPLAVRLYAAVLRRARGTHAKWSSGCFEAGADVNETMRPEATDAAPHGKPTSAADSGGRERPFRAGRGPAEGRRRSERSARRLHGAARDHLGPQADPRRRRPAADRLGEAEQPGLRPAACGARRGSSTPGSRRANRAAADSRPRVRRRSCWRPGRADVPLMQLLARAGRRSRSCRTPTTARRCWPRPASGRWATATKRPAPKRKRSKPCRLLLELGADVNAVDDNGETAMHGAAYQSRCQARAAAGRARRGHQRLEPQEQVGLDAADDRPGTPPRQLPTRPRHDRRHRAGHACRRR